MITFITIIGATLRYWADHIFNKGSSKKSWWDYWYYYDEIETEFVDKILGSIVIVILIYISIEVIN